MLFSTNPAHIAAYSQRTEDAPVKMANCTFKTFRCKKCGQPKSIQGRKSLGWKAGFKCAECAQ